MLVKCPNDGETMEIKEGVHVCPECDKTLTISEAEELFEAGEIVAILEDKDGDDDEEDEDGETDKEEKAEKEKMKVKESILTKLSDYSNVSKVLRAGRKGTMSEDFMLDLVESLIGEGENINLLDMAELVEWANTVIEDSAKVSEDLVTALAGDDTLSEEVKSDVVTVFESALHMRSKMIKEHESAVYAKQLAEAEVAIRESVEDEVDGYLDTVVTEWMSENKLAVDTGVKVEMTEAFLDGLQELFAEHYVEIPEGKEDVIESLAEQVTELESEISEMKKDEAKVVAKLVEMKKESVFIDVSSDLADTKKEKLSELAESVEFVEEEAYKAKLLKLKESFLSDPVKPTKVEEGNLSESESDTDTGSEFDYIAGAVKVLSAKH